MLKRHPFIRVVLGGALLFWCSGCAGVSPAQFGQTAGAITGSLVAPAVGAPIGALVGTLAGMVVQGQVDKATEKRERKELGDELHAGTSSVASDRTSIPSGEPTRVWVDETNRDGRLTPGHFETRSI